MRRAAVVLPACVALLAGAGCPSDERAGESDPRPLGAAPAAAYDLQQKAVDAALPERLDAYELQEVVWEGTMPVAVRLERWKRGECLTRKRYAPGPKGPFALEEVEARAGATGGPAAPGTVALADLLDAAASPGRGGLHAERDPTGRLAWTWSQGKQASQGRPAREVVTLLRYDGVGACTLPNLIDRMRLPPKKVPVRRPDRKAP